MIVPRWKHADAAAFRESPEWLISYPPKVLGVGNELMVDGKQCEFQAVGNANLVEDISQVVLYGLLANRILTGDFLICKTRYDSSDDVELTGGQSEILLPLFCVFAAVAAGGRRKICMKNLDEIGNAVLSYPEFVINNSTDALEQNLRRSVLQDDTPGA